MKKLLALGILGLMLVGTVAEARHGHRGGHRGHRHGHRHGGHRWHRGGWWGPGYGWGYRPGFAVSVPLGGGTSTDKSLRNAMKQWKRTGQVQSFCNWANDVFNHGKAQELCTQYNTHQRGGYTSYSRPAGAISFGVGGGYGYPGYGWGRRGWW